MIRRAIRLSLLAATLTACCSAFSTDDLETVRTSNAAILNRLGLIAQHPTDGHHRKRLAADSDTALGRVHQPPPYGRRHGNGGGSPHDSHVYIVKLPPSPPYYSFSKPLKLDEDPNVTVALPNPGFRSNGRPAKIYHWNLPLVKKINERKKQMALLRMDQARRNAQAEKERQRLAEKMSYLKKLAHEQLLVDDGQGRTKPTRNNDKWLSHPEKAKPRIKTPDGATQLKILSSVASSSSGPKTYRLEEGREAQRIIPGWNDVVVGQRDDGLDNHRAGKPKKHKKKSAVSYYYAPALTGKSASTSISKHFPGNGKPKGFYVMEKSRKPIYYHQLLP